MAWRLTLAVAVVCVGSVCSNGQVDLMSRLLMQRDYGVKLCGREFIRAVIFTCGGSRWRRSTDDFGECKKKNQKPKYTGAPLLSSQSLSLADLLAIYGALGERQNFSLGVAGMCCSQGCTKNDIGRLC
uniref:Insulin-like domain-containing protein n=1 Tax=Periophthalmus magnuspinnatus TaxID=409849 RepID=A0A3B4BMR1_9GOBI